MNTHGPVEQKRYEQVGKLRAEHLRLKECLLVHASLQNATQREVLFGKTLQ